MSAVNEINEYYSLPAKLARALETLINEGEIWLDVKARFKRNYPDVLWEEIEDQFLKHVGCLPEEYIENFGI